MSGEIVKEALLRFADRGWAAEFVAGIALGLIFPLITYFMSGLKASIYGAVACVTLIVWLVAYTLATAADAVEARRASSAPVPAPAAAPLPSATLPESTVAPTVIEPKGSQTDPPSKELPKEQPSQVMINSPGGIQAGRDVNISADRRIIQSLELTLHLYERTSTRALSDPATDFGIQSIVAFFTKSGERLRFATDFRFADQQIAPDTRRVTFIYTPENPSQILGRPIADLASIEKLAVNFSETVGFAQPIAETSLDMVLRLNGVEVIREVGSSEPTGILVKGQATFDVGQFSARVPSTFLEKVSRTGT